MTNPPSPPCQECGAPPDIDHWPNCLVEQAAVETYWADRAAFDDLDPDAVVLTRALRRPSEEIELRARGFDPDDIDEPVRVYSLPGGSHRRELGPVTFTDVLHTTPPGAGS